MAARTRVTRDSMGEMQVPEEAHYGASTQRAVENFPVSGQLMPLRFVRALGLIKRAAAKANASLGLLPAELEDPINTFELDDEPLSSLASADRCDPFGERVGALIADPPPATTRQLTEGERRTWCIREAERISLPAEVIAYL